VNEAITISSSPPGTPSGPGRLRIEAGHDVVVAAPITTPGGALSITAAKFTNRSAISNGVGGFTSGMTIAADAFDLAAGTIDGGNGVVGLAPRTASNSLGVESLGDTTLTNGDIASITIAADSPGWISNQLSIGARTLAIGANAQVDAGTKNLLLNSFNGAGTTITIGVNGVTTTGDVGINAGPGGALGGTGTIG